MPAHGQASTIYAADVTSDIAFLTDGIGAYVNAHTVPPTPLEQRLIDETHELGGVSVMQIGPAQARFMALLTRILRPKVAVEIGTFTGYSALVVAQELAADAMLIACDISDEWTSVGRPYWEDAGVADRIDLRIGPAAETLRAFDSEISVDLAFIDADKPGYWTYLDLLAPHLHERSVVLVDNVLWDGQILETDDDSPDTVALRDFNDRVLADPRFDVALLPIGDGISFITRAR